MKNINKAPFINRQTELAFLHSWIEEEPKNILFMFGPKSSGKTTLLQHFIKENLTGKHYDLKHFNLRKILITNYSDFIQTFFELDYSKSKGKRPVIIIDELQALEGIYFNGQRELLTELFNFFVAMTKEAHLCHIIIASSDGYFIERIYRDSKLRKTAKFQEVNYLARKEITHWLNHIDTLSNITQFTLNEQQRKEIWDNSGGSCWEISALLGDLLLVARNGIITAEDFNQVLQNKRIASRSVFVEYAGLSTQKRTLFLHINKIINERNGFFEELDLELLVDDNSFTEKEIRNNLAELVRHNIFAYNPVTAVFTLQGKSLEIGLDMYVDRVSKKWA